MKDYSNKLKVKVNGLLKKSKINLNSNKKNDKYINSINLTEGYT